MKIEAIRLMRELRDEIFVETKDMTWMQEHEYLQERLTVFPDIVSKAPNKSLQPTAETATRFRGG